ncbi:Two-component system sensor histidine kinase [Flavobacterium branchiophilum]|uniref:Two-component system sensor histidine kinase n=1 Tax=Flavobacterium branchiophilum (strain FL-15) TaxID=1034807 RepID=G2Z5W1_FLABF|nr:tetratricopeptide repeat protein [Flavobacterium branchiophilum]CCB68721.1 Two-component system sensor histidine kinase [Flavobacterium branchiophilum FL-15]
MKNRLKIGFYFLIVILCHCIQAQTTEIDSLKKLMRVAKTDTLKVNLYNKIADYYKTITPDSTQIYAQKAQFLAQKVGYSQGLGQSYINTGISHLIFGDYRKASSYFLKSKVIFEKLLSKDENNKNFKNGLARSSASMGIIYTEQNNYYLALESYEIALKIYQEINDKPSISKAYNNIGVVYKSMLNYPKAITFLQKAFEIQQEIGEQNAAVTVTNIGAIYFEQDKNKEAFHYYNKANELFKKTDNKRGLALLYNYYGDYYVKENNRIEGKIYYEKALQLCEEIQNKFGASLALYNIGQLLANEKKYSQAMVFAQKSLDYATEIGVLDQTFHSEQLVSELYGILGDSKASLEHYKKYIVARDSINNQESAKKFAIAEMNFEYKKKEAILAEKQKNQTQLIVFLILGMLLLSGLLFVLYTRMQIKKRLTLQKEVAEYEQKALHLQMNPHFVFNCLSSISSFIVQNGTDSALKYLSKFSKLMRLTLEYSKEALIPIDKEIESLQNYLELEQLRFHNAFDFSIHSTENVEFNVGLPPLLIQPFVENAILHGIVPKEEKGKIAVQFDQEDGKLICTITDDGIGLLESKTRKENSVTAHKSMALDITKKRLEIMEATLLKSAQIEIQDLKANSQTGTKVTLKLPIQYV